MRISDWSSDVCSSDLRAVADDGGGQRRALAAILLIDVLHDLLAALVLEVDVDVGRLLALGGDEALEQQVHARGIDLGDAEAEADGRVGGRAAALAERSEERRVGEEWVSPCRSRWSAYH